MKVNLQLDTSDNNGGHTLTNLTAVLDKSGDSFHLKYVEKLDEEGKITTKSELWLSETQMRIRRTGAMETDFLYENSLVHNTVYSTPYGKMPISIETKSYSMTCKKSAEAADALGDGNVIMLDEFSGDFVICANTTYDMTIRDCEPMSLSVAIKITPI